MHLISTLGQCLRLGGGWLPPKVWEVRE